MQNSKIFSIAILLVVVQFAAPLMAAVSTAPRTVRMAMLVLTPTGDTAQEPTLAAARQTLQSMAIPYDELVLTKSGSPVVTGQLPLVDANGRGRYQAIILTNGDLEYTLANGSYQSALTTAQWQQLADYETQFGVRRVALFAGPWSTPGVTTGTGTGAGGTSAAAVVKPAAAALQADPAFSSTAQIPIPEGCWRYSAAITDATIATPFLQYTGSTTGIAAVVSAQAGREQLSFFFDAGDWSLASVVLGSLWARWAARGEFLGYRRIYLSTQVDDLFISTDLWNPALNANPEDGKRVYRCKATDMIALSRAQTNLVKLLPAGSSIKAEFAFNGQGVDEAGGAAKDSLFIGTKSLASDFYFLNHTWSHQVLNDLTYAQSYAELKTNHDFMMNSGGTLVARYGKTAIVTPEISGLFNPAALEAMKSLGIKSVVSDNTRPEFATDNPWHGTVTTKAVHGADGILVVPRFATELYYDASTPEELVSEYNNRYRSYWGKNLTISQIFTEETNRAARSLLQYRHDPHMFHQSNLRVFSISKVYPSRTGDASLLSIWQEAIAKEVAKYSKLPIVTLPMEQLASTFQRRMTMDAAKPEIMRTIDPATGKVTYQVKAAKACMLPLTGVTIQKAGALVEVYGPETTSWITCPAGTTLTFTR